VRKSLFSFTYECWLFPLNYIMRLKYWLRKRKYGTKA
jgi:hypothetical protein